MADNDNSNAGGSSAGDTTRTTPGITPEQLHAAIEKARLEEREKLRNQLDTTRADADKLRMEMETIKGQLAKLTDENSSLKAAVSAAGGGVDLEKAIAQAADAASARVGAGFSQKIAELEKAYADERAAREALAIERLRDRLIKEAGGETAVIPELIRGSNEDEIRDSIKRSKETLEGIFKRAATSGGSAPSNTASSHGNAGAGVPNIQLPTNGNPQGGSVNVAEPNYREMSMADWAKIRGDVKKKVASRYTNSVLT